MPAHAVSAQYGSLVIDTHCHLTFPDFQHPAPAEPATAEPTTAEPATAAADGPVIGLAGGVEGVLRRAREQGVLGCITISTTTRDCLAALAVAERFPNVWCTAGVHPLYSDEGPHAWENLRAVASSPRCVAWGELGLDNHYETPPRDVQRSVLEEQLAFLESCAKAGIAKPVVLHCREAFDDLIPILRRTTLDPSRMVFHCFTAGEREMRLLLDFGACVSFTGVVTYKNAADLRAAAKLPPLSRIMVETDAPFLSPHPHRGVRPCEPWMASVTARALAELRGERWDDFHAGINDTTRRFFGVSLDQPATT